MATFIHLADVRDSKKILRDGIRPSRVERRGGVFCVPVVPSFQTTFQWLRELKRKSPRTICAIQFKIPDTELVLVGRYNQRHREVMASEAVAVFQASDDVRGFEVLITRRIEPKEIMRVRTVPQISGWRFYPEAKGRNPLWPPKGSIKASRVRRSVEKNNRSPFEK